MHTLLVILGILGFAAVAVRASRTVFRLLHGGVEAFMSREIANTRARRGDLTGYQDALEHQLVARRRRRLALITLLLWGGLLLLPPLTPWPVALYAAYSLLWLVPHGRVPRA